MTRTEFETAAETILAEAKAMRDKRGASYAGVDNERDAHGNFRRISQHLAADPRLVAVVYLLKHIDSIATIVAGGEDGGEPIRERVLDAINYLLFLETLS